MSAIVAVIADNVGRKLGKQRRSLKFKRLQVRPKHVAMIGTALTGILVSFSTIAVVTIASKDVRDWIVKGRNAIKESESLTRQNGVLDGQIRVKQTKIDAQETLIKQAATDLKIRTAELKSRKAEIDKLNHEVKLLRPQIEKYRDAVKLANRKRKEIEDALKSRKLALAGINSQLHEVREELRVAKETRNEAISDNQALQTKNLELFKRNQDLVQKQADLNKKIVELNASRVMVEAAREQANADLSDAKATLLGLQAQLSTTREQLQTSQSELQQATITSLLYRDISKVPRVASMMYKIQEEVTRLSVDDGQSVVSARAALERLLRNARFAAIERGAKPNDQYPEAGIFERRDVRTGEPITGDAITETLVSQIVRSRGPVVLVAYSSLNAFRGEPVSLDITVYANPLVYKKGQVVAESRIDGRLDDMAIFRQLSEFLSVRLKERATEAQLIPRLGTTEAFGSVSSEEIIRLVGNVKATERVVRLQALADADTRAGDPLKLTFQIRM